MKIIRIFQRVIDIISSTLFTVLILSWITPILAILIKIESKGPVFVKRLTKNKFGLKSYKYEFRTFTLKNDNAYKFSKIGIFMHKNSLQSIPSFLNILQGNLTLTEYLVEQELITLNRKWNFKNLFLSLKYIIPSSTRIEIVDLIDQTKDDISEMKKDMISKNLPNLWVQTIIIFNIISVIVSFIVSKIKDYFL